jgi:hypothetical protein
MLTKETAHTELRNLHKQKVSDKFVTCVTTDEQMMRNADYRSKQVLTLFVLRAFSSKTAFLQGMARVGRQNDPAQRIGLKD